MSSKTTISARLIDL